MRAWLRQGSLIMVDSFAPLFVLFIIFSEVLTSFVYFWQETCLQAEVNRG